MEIKQETAEKNSMPRKIFLERSKGNSMNSYYLFARSVTNDELSALGLESKLDGPYIALLHHRFYEKGSMLAYEKVEVCPGEDCLSFNSPEQFFTEIANKKFEIIREEKYNSSGEEAGSSNLTKLLKNVYNYPVESEIILSF